MKKINVGFVTYALRSGGMETFLFRLGENLTNQGLEVEIVTTTEPGEWFNKARDFQIQVSHIEGYQKTRRFASSLHSLRVGNWLKRRNFDVIFLNHTVHAQAAIGMLPDHTLVVPIVHNDTDYVYRVGCANERAWNRIIGVSTRVCETIARTIPSDKIELITYGVDLPTRDVVWQTRSSIEYPIRIAFVGRLYHEQKGILLLPEIVKDCLAQGVDVELIVIGSGPDESQLKQKFNEFGLFDRVKFLGMVAPEDVYAYLLDCHITLVPSFYEGLGIIILEAMACGSVPIASQISKVTDFVITDGNNGRLISIGDTHGFVKAIVSLVRQPELWRSMSESAHETATERFSVTRMGDAYLRLIEKGLSGAYPLPISRRWQLPLDLRMFRR